MIRFFSFAQKSSKHRCTKDANASWVRGFTLVEMLVVIAIIAVLSTLVLFMLSTAREKGRDTKRKSDISQIGRFFVLSCYMPDAGSGTYDLAELASEVIAKNPQAAKWLSQIPKDPVRGTKARTYYEYIVEPSGSKCALYANLEHESENITLPLLSAPTAGGGTGVLEASSNGWNGTDRYFQASN